MIRSGTTVLCFVGVNGEWITAESRLLLRRHQRATGPVFCLSLRLQNEPPLDFQIRPEARKPFIIKLGDVIPVRRIPRTVGTLRIAVAYRRFCLAETMTEKMPSWDLAAVYDSAKRSIAGQLNYAELFLTQPDTHPLQQVPMRFFMPEPPLPLP